MNTISEPNIAQSTPVSTEFHSSKVRNWEGISFSKIRITFNTKFNTLQESSLILTNPISVVCEETEYGTWIATFTEANIGMPGDTVSDACEALSHDIGHAFKFLSSNEARLGSDLKKQLFVLRKYLKRKC